MHMRSIGIRTVWFVAVWVILGGQAGAQTATPAPFDAKTAYSKAAFYIPMRDGVRLYTVIYTPKDASQKYPILMQRTPYGSGPYDADTINLGGPTEMAREGYIFVK